MSIIDDHGPSQQTAERRPLEFPPTTGHFGPVTKSRLTRTWITYGVVFAIGVVLCVIGSDAWRGFGLGLIAPGGGFLYAAGVWSLLWFALTFGLMYLGYVLWFAAGNVVMPLAVWLGSAVLAGVASRSGGRAAFLVIVP